MLMLAIGLFAAVCAEQPPLHADAHRDAREDAQPPRTEGSPRTDQTVPVQRGARLDVNAFAGEVTVSAWNRDAVRVQAEHSTRERVDVRANGTQVLVRVRSTIGPPGSMNLRITVPTWMRLDVNGTYADVTVDGVQAQINVDTVSGDVSVKGGADFVTLKSVEGVITLEGAKGRINVESVNDGIKLTNISGDVVAETINGSLTMQRMQADSVEASAVNGEVTFEGAIRNDGQYRISSHNGDVNLTIPDNASATVSVRTYNGSFVPNFQVQASESSPGRRFNFTLGSGSARITLESFGGTIRITKGGRR